MRRKLTERELRELAAAIACAQFNQRANADGVYGVFEARDLAWVRRNRVVIRQRKDGSVRVDVIYSREYQRELGRHAESRRERIGTATI